MAIVTSIIEASTTGVGNQGISGFGQPSARKIVENFATGELFALYLNTTAHTSLRIRRSGDLGATWADEVTFTLTTTSGSEALAIDSNGKVHVVWQEAQTAGAGKIFYSSRTSLQVWSTPVQIDDNSKLRTPGTSDRGIALTIDHLDKLHVVCVALNLTGSGASQAAFYLTNESGSWVTSKLDTTTTFTYLGKISLLSDSSGNLHAVCTVNNGANISWRYFRKAQGASWANWGVSFEVIDQIVGSFAQEAATLCLDSTGRPIVGATWVASSINARVKMYRRPPGTFPTAIAWAIVNVVDVDTVVVNTQLGEADISVDADNTLYLCYPRRNVGTFTTKSQVVYRTVSPLDVVSASVLVTNEDFEHSPNTPSTISYGYYLLHHVTPVIGGLSAGVPKVGVAGMFPKLNGSNNIDVIFFKSGDFQVEEPPEPPDVDIPNFTQLAGPRRRRWRQMAGPRRSLY